MRVTRTKAERQGKKNGAEGSKNEQRICQDRCDSKKLMGLENSAGEALSRKGRKSMEESLHAINKTENQKGGGGGSEQTEKEPKTWALQFKKVKIKGTLEQRKGTVRVKKGGGRVLKKTLTECERRPQRGKEYGGIERRAKK